MRNDTEVFEKMSVPRAVAELAVPTIITQLIGIIYNFADTWYVGRTNNAAMVAAMSVSMPVFVLMAAIANLFGIGGASVISRSLGAKRPERGRIVFAFCVWGALLGAVLYALALYFGRGRLILLIGGDDASFAYTSDYMFWAMVIGAIPTVGNVLLGHLVRSVGAAREAGFGMSMGAVLNMILDPLLMFVILPPGHEVTGAAVATLLSNAAATIYFLRFILRHRENPIFTLSLSDAAGCGEIAGEVLLIGIPAALQTSLAMLSNIFANALVSGYGSEAVAGMGVAKKINTLAFNTNMGLTQGVLPLLGYSYGAGNMKRMKQVIRFTAVTGLIFTTLCCVSFRVFAPSLVRFFIRESQSVRFGREFLKVIALATPLGSFSYLMNTVFQATGRKFQSMIVSMLRKGLLDVPLMFLFRSRMGVFGVVWATPCADLLGAVLAITLFVLLIRRLESEYGRGEPRRQL